MRLTLISAVMILITGFFACTKPHRYAPGNTLENWVQSEEDPATYIDFLEDTLGLKRIGDNLYVNRDKKVYIRTVYRDHKRGRQEKREYYTEYLKEITDFLDINSYKVLHKGFFTTRGKVYLWWASAQGHYPVEVKGADPETFVPFEGIAGGTDKNHVFYGGPPADFEVIPDADPHTIRILNPEQGCWNCGDCYFTDRTHVFFGMQAIREADPATFQLLSGNKTDARDKYRRYYHGQPVEQAP